MSNASFKMNGVEVFSENAQTVTVKNINVAANDTTTPSMCKAWVNFDGTLAMTVNSSYGPDSPPADYSSPNPIRAAYNVDYIIDRGTGIYEIHFANAMPEANYATPTSISINSSGNSGSQQGDLYVNSHSTTSYLILAANNGSFTDMGVVTSAVFR